MGFDVTTTSKLVLGTVQLGMKYGINNTVGKPSNSDAFEILDEAYKEGISILDTAENYGDSTEIIGRFNAKTEKKFSVITKFIIQSSQDRLNEKLSTICNITKVSKLYALMYHRVSQIREYPHIFSDVIKEREIGHVERIGASIYTNDEFNECIDNPEIDVIQFPFNLFDNVLQRGNLMERAKDHGKELHVRSVFLQGLFFKPLQTLTGNLVQLKKPLKMLQDISMHYGIHLHDLALSYAISNIHIDKILIGVETKEQLVMNIQASLFEIPNSVIKEIECILVDEPLLLNPTHWKP